MKLSNEKRRAFFEQATKAVKQINQMAPHFSGDSPLNQAPREEERTSPTRSEMSAGDPTGLCRSKYSICRREPNPEEELAFQFNDF
jgi:hypothetical protein